MFGNHTTPIGGGVEIKTSTYYVPGIVALGIIAASFVNLVITITEQREQNVLKRRRATPVPAWVLIAGRALTSVVVSAAIVVVLISRRPGRVRRHASHGDDPRRRPHDRRRLDQLLLPRRTRLRASSAQPTPPSRSSRPSILPLYFISGVFVPDHQIPSWLRHVADVFPVRHLAQALLTAFNPTTSGAGIAGRHLLILAAWGVAGLIVALRRFSWVPTGERS